MCLTPTSGMADGGSLLKRQQRPLMPLAKRGLLVAVLLFGLLSLVATDGDLKVQHDSGVYITLAKSLATGQGYRSIYLAGDPPHTRYPPVFPLLLAPLVGVAGYHFLAMKLLVTAIALLTLYLLYVFFSELANDVMGFLVVIFTATSHGLLFYAQSIMTEIPYLCFSLLALLWVHCQTQRQAWARTTMAVAAALISLTYLTRLIGLSLLVATLVYLACDSPGRLKIRIKHATTIGGFRRRPCVGLVFAQWMGGSTWWKRLRDGFSPPKGVCRGLSRQSTCHVLSGAQYESC